MNTVINDRIAKINNGQVPEGYEKTSFGIFPCDWEKAKLSDIAEFCGGGTPSTKIAKYWEGDIPWISSSDISEGDLFNVQMTRYITKEAIGNSATKLCPKGSIAVVTRVGVGKLAYIDCDYCTSQDFSNIIKCSIKKEYLLYKLHSAIQKYVEKAQGTSIKGITTKELLEIVISYPKTEQEQSRIAQILMQWDKTIELQEKLIKSYQKLKKYYLSKMFPKKGSLYPEIRFAGFTEPWEMRNLGDIGTTYGGLTGKTKEDFGHGDAKFVTYMNVFTNPIGKPDMTESVEYDSSQNEVKKGDVLFTTSSETPEEVGMSCVWMEDLPNTYLNSFCFGYRPIMDFDLHYLAYVLRSDSIRQKIILLAQGISRYNISKSKVM